MCHLGGGVPLDQIDVGACIIQDVRLQAFLIFQFRVQCAGGLWRMQHEESYSILAADPEVLCQGADSWGPLLKDGV
jgi:hypothetical protein